MDSRRLCAGAPQKKKLRCRVRRSHSDPVDPIQRRGGGVEAGDDEDQDDGDDEVTKRFPYSVGTWVAFEFHEGIFAGTITEVFDEDAECQVTFTDGDKGDYDADEICYAIQLYQVKFGKEKTNIP